MPGEIFDDLTDIYEAIIDWPKRLANEQGLYRTLFEEISAKRILDVACGVGHHAALFHSWGLEVEGADLSANMIRRARERFGEPPSLRWIVRGFDQPAHAPESFDVAICVGNSLALAPDESIAATAVRQMLAAIRPGGAIVVHVLNLWRLPDGPPVWQKCQHVAPSGEESLVIKGVHRCGSRGYVDLLVTRLDQPPRLRSESVPFLGLSYELLAHLARSAGASDLQFFGSYSRDPYAHLESQDLILVARK